VTVYNEILAGRFNRFVQKYLSMKGPTSLVAVTPDLRLVHQFFSGAENRYTEGWDSYGIFVQVAATAAQTSQFSFRNPLASGIVAVVTRLQVSDPTPGTAATSSTICNIVRGMTTDQNTGIVNAPLNWDQRGRPMPTIVVTKNVGVPVATGGTAVSFYSNCGFAANAAQEIMGPAGLPEIPILPLSGLLIVSGAVNTALSVNIWWRERPLEDSEKF